VTDDAGAGLGRLSIEEEREKRERGWERFLADHIRG
jgi:hypothetical protein